MPQIEPILRPAKSSSEMWIPPTDARDAGLVGGVVVRRPLQGRRPRVGPRSTRERRRRRRVHSQSPPGKYGLPVNAVITSAAARLNVLCPRRSRRTPGSRRSAAGRASSRREDPARRRASRCRVSGGCPATLGSRSRPRGRRGARGVLPARSSRGDHLDETGNERQALRDRRTARWIARLARPPCSGSSRSGAPSRRPLRSPRGDGGVVHGAVEREVELDVPFEPVEAPALAADPPPNPGESETSFAITFQWPGGVSDAGPSAQNSVRTRPKSPRGTAFGA